MVLKQLRSCDLDESSLSIGKVNPSNGAAFVQRTDQEAKIFEKYRKPCHVGIHWIALTEYSQMSTNLPGFRSFFRFLASLDIGQISHQQYKGYVR